MREIAGVFVFFFLTSKGYEGKSYITITNKEWIFKKRGHLKGVSRIELSRCCTLSSDELVNKLSKKIMSKTGEVSSSLIDRLRTAYENNEYRSPIKPRKETFSVDLAFCDYGEISNSVLSELNLI